MKPFLIYFWHGRPDPKSRFAQKVDKLCRLRPEDGVYFWDGTLDAFAHQWGEKFIYMPATDPEAQYVLGRICITPHGGFGQR